MKLFEILQSEAFKEAKNHLAQARESIKAALNGTILYRGASIDSYAKEIGDLPGGYVLYFVEGRTTPRSSLTGTSIFLDITKYSPKWKNVPKRTLSTFCSPSFNAVTDFGDTQIVIPLDKVKSFATMQGDFNEQRFAMKGDSLMSLGGLVNDINSISEKANTTLDIISSIIVTGDLATLQKGNYDYERLMRDFVKTIKTQDEFQSIKTALYDSRILKVLIKHRQAVGTRDDPEFSKFSVSVRKINAVGEVIRCINETVSSGESEVAAFLNGIDAWVTIVYRCGYFERVFGRFTGPLFASVENVVTPEKMGVEITTSVKAAVKKEGQASEIWFEGPYFMISRGSYDHRKNADQVGVSKYLQQDDVKEFLKSI